jgi:endo-1,4-beta-xylanase
MNVFTPFNQARSAIRNFYGRAKKASTLGVLCLSGFVTQAQNPVVVQAESGTLGASFTTGTAGSVQYVTVVGSATGTSPGSDAKVNTYSITFPEAGIYDLYVRVRVGAAAGDDDSFFYGNGFGTKNSTTASNWVVANNLAGAGWANSGDIVLGNGSAGTGVWKWIKLSGSGTAFGGSAITFTVPAGSLTQTFQIGGREDGLDIDKFLFAKTGLFFTVNMLDNGLPGTTSPPGEKYPQTVQAESGVLGASFTTQTISGVQFITVTTNGGGDNPGDNTRIVTYTITFPFAGTFDLYARIRVGTGGANDDSFFYGNGFGTKSATNNDDWITVNGLSNVGYTGTHALVAGAGTAGAGVNKWIKLSEFNGGEAPIQFDVPAGNLTQTFQIGGREDGFLIDKFVFAKTGTYFSVTNLDNVQQGVTDPPFDPTGLPPIAQGKPKFLGNVYSGPQIPFFTNYWNQVTPENGGKWGSVEGTRDVMNWGELDAAYKLAKDNGFPFRFHIFVWGNQQPAWIESLPPAEQLEEIEEWIAAVANRYPALDYIEVVNEPLHDPPNSPGSGGGSYINALGGSGTTGWDWIINAFKLARKYFPNGKLVLNDYSVENSLTEAQRYVNIVNLLKAQGLIDIIGFQGHAFSTTVPSATLKACVDLFAATGLPLQVTELDIDGATDQIQLDAYKRIFPIFWEHPSITGVTLWGWRLGHWRTAQGAHLVNVNGSERPALVWLREYVNNTKPIINAGQLFSVLENAANGTGLGSVQVIDPDMNQVHHSWTWQITGGSGMGKFAINASTGALSVLNNSSFDFESAIRSYTLTLTVNDGFATSDVQTITVNLTNANDNAPVVTSGMSFSLDGGSCSELGNVTATDADDTNEPGFTTFQNWQIVGGSGSGIFAINTSTGMITIANLKHVDLKNNSYTLLVTVSDGLNTSAEQTVIITIPDKITVCHKGQLISVSKMAAIGHIQHGDCIGSCSTGNTSRYGIASAPSGNSNILVYPNPVKDRININLGSNTDNIRKIQVLDLSGRIVMEMNVGKTSNSITIPGKLRAGTYFVRLQGDKSSNHKIVVQ